MSDNRRTPSRGGGPAGRSGPGRRPSTTRTTGRATGGPSGGSRGSGAALPAAGARTAPEAGSTRAQGSAATAPARPRLTGRAAILVLVLAVLAVSYASSLRAYLTQRDHIEALQSTISAREGEIADLTVERDRWKDPDFVAIQARARLGYVKPGETPFVATRDGVPIEGDATLSDPDGVAVQPVQPWFGQVWDSAKVAGDPPLRTRPPATRIDGTNGTD